MTLYINGHGFKYELENLIKMFFPLIRVEVVYDSEVNEVDDENNIVTTRDVQEAVTLLSVVVECQGKIGTDEEEIDNNTADYESECERLFAVMLYRLLEQMTDVHPKWGILTGIRPVKLVEDRVKQGKSREQIVKEFSDDLLVAPEKTELLLQIEEVQRPVVRSLRPKGYSLYIAVPFCPTRCHYCSFVSHSVENAQKLIPEYLDRLCEELQAIGALADELGLELQTIYIGGGTPTTLSAEQLSRLFSVVREQFDCSALSEFTVEAGRADTITEEKLWAIQQGGATKISINPQTMNNKVLETIGRQHTAEQVRNAYHLARDMGFKNINMDLIAGLSGDTYESFCKTVDSVIKLAPESITVHTLSVKRSSALYRDQESIEIAKTNPTVRMTSYSQRTLAEKGYHPYYLYRQKNTLQNLENVGFCQPGHEGIYNIYIMEELQTILAAGAGGVTKLVNPSSGFIERVFNFKFPYEYLDRFDQILGRKEKVREFYETNF